MVSIGVLGACGKMGSVISRLVEDDSELILSAAMESESNPNIGKPIGDVLNIYSQIRLSTIDEADLSNVDVIIDFSLPEATEHMLRRIDGIGVSLVIGTTGLNKEQRKTLSRVSSSVPIVFAPNMSLGVNILFNLVESVARMLNNYDIEIVEMHHRLKKDAPSGTALRLAEHAARGIGKNLEEVAVYGRHGTIGERKKDEIGIMTLRGGNVVGEHTVIFAGPGERLELTHRASSRETFAMGAIRAAKWIVSKKPGLYDMGDVLGLK